MNPSSVFRLIRTGSLAVLLLGQPVRAASLLWFGDIDPTWDYSTPNWTDGGLSAVFNNSDIVTFDDSGLATTINLASLVAPESVTVDNTAQDYTFTGPGAIGDAGSPTSLTKSGSGTLTILTENTYTGGTTILTGSTVVLGNCGTSGWIVGNVVNQGMLVFSPSTNRTFPGIISGSGGVIKNCPAVLTLSGHSTYTGSTSVAAGKLCVQGSIASPTTVFAGATLGGSGHVHAPIFVSPGGVSSPGCSIGTLTTGSATINGSHACELDGATCDKLVINGNLDLTGATLEITTLGPPTAEVYVIMAYSGTRSTTFATVNGLPSGYSVDYSVSGQVRLAKACALLPPLFNCATEVMSAGGVDDNFAGPEPAAPSAGLVARLTGVGASLKGFDDPEVNRVVAHTFLLPADCTITAARLTARLKSCGDICDNDSGGLTFTASDGTQLPGGWGRYFGTVPGIPEVGLMPDDWCNHTTGEIFTLDLAALPKADGSTVDLLPLLNANRFVDFTCQDDTAVDYLILEVVRCCGCNPADKTVECGTGWTFDTPTATDACTGASVPVIVLSTVTTGTCPQVITRTWQATDACGNSATCSQTVTVVDTTPPVLTCSPNKTVECCPATITLSGVVDRVEEDPFGMDSLPPPWDTVLVGDPWSITYTFDPAAPDVHVPPEFSPSTLGSYPSAVSKFSVTAGTASTTQTVGPAASSTLNVFNNQPAPYDQYDGRFNWLDDSDYMMAYFQFAVEPATVWNTDELPLCVDLADFTTAHFMLESMGGMPMGPSLHGVITAVSCPTSPCGSWRFDPPTVSDGCGGSDVTISVLSTVTTGTCPKVITRTWQATDACGNSATCSQTVTVVDTTPPVFCATEVMSAGGVADDFAGPEPAAPSAGLVARLTGLGATLKGFDDPEVNRVVAHTFLLPADGTITAARLTARLKSCGEICSNDNGGLTFTKSDGTMVPGGWGRFFGTDSGNSEVGLMPDDWCNHTTGEILTLDLAALPKAAGGTIDLLPLLNANRFVDFTCQDDTAVDYLILEVVTCRSCGPTAKTVECGTGWTFDTPTATDACTGASVPVIILSTVTTGTCPQVITRTWQATDACGNSATCSQTVTVVDTTPPVLTCAPDKTITCGGAWDFDTPTATDACSGSNVTITVLSTVVSGTCPQIITRTWTATDPCGNSATCSQTVTVEGALSRVWNTGGTGAQAAGFTVIQTPAGSTNIPAVLTTVTGAWMPNTADSSWVSYTANSEHSAKGFYIYRLSFYLASTNCASIIGRYSTDDGSSIFLNGVDTGVPSAIFTAWTSVNITSGFVVGLNTLEIRVNNEYDRSWTGLRAELINTFQCCTARAVDLFIEDTPYKWSGSPDTGREPEPNMSGAPMYMSRGIWVRNSPDGGTIHQNPEYGQANRVYAKVTNLGCLPAQNAVVRFYYANASTGLTWPRHWNLIGEQTIALLDPAASVNASVVWWPPDPKLSKGGHFCLLARIVSAEDPMTVAETGDVNTNTRANNNIAWRNTNVVDLLRKPHDSDIIKVRHTGEMSKPLKFVFTADDDFLMIGGEMVVDLGELYERWEAGGMQGLNVTPVGGTIIRLTGSPAIIEGIPFAAGEEQELMIATGAPQPMPVPGVSHEYHLDLVQIADGEEVGGVAFAVTTRAQDTDTDGDLIPDVTDPDDDNDGIPDVWELAHGFNPLDPTDAALDPDRDNKTNLAEYQANTDPYDLQTTARLTALGFDAAGSFQLRFEAAPNRTHTVRESHTLNGDWAPVLTVGPWPVIRTIGVAIPAEQHISSFFDIHLE